MRRPRAGDERSSQALGRRRGSARRPIRAACQELADGAASPSCQKQGRAPAQSAARRRRFRLRLWAKRNETARKRARALHDVRAARREALPHLRKEMRILTDYGSAPWRAIPSHPEGQRDQGKTGLPGASIKEYGRWRLAKALTCLAFPKSGLYKPGITHADTWL